VRNRDARDVLAPPGRRDLTSHRPVAARATRHSHLLRAHGLIHRVGKTYYYRPTQKGYEVMNTALKFWETDIALLAVQVFG
jgi:hypothetical protein